MTPTRLTWDSASNTLRLTLDQRARPTARAIAVNGLLDVASNGRLMGVELHDVNFDLARGLRAWLSDPIAGEFTQFDADGSAYIELSEGARDDDVRSSAVLVSAELDHDGALAALVIPRRGHGYEVSFPSGNR